jgi:hypothetical protein
MNPARAGPPVAGTVHEALRIYARHWPLLMALGVVVLLPQAIAASAADGIEIERLETPGDYLRLAAIPITVVISLAGEALLAGVITALVVQWRLGHRIPGLLAFAGSLAWLRLIMVDLVLAIGSAIGLLLLIIPGIVFLVYFATAPALIEIEDRGVVEALRRSAKLVRGHFLAVLILVAGVIVLTEGLAQLLLALFHGFIGELASEVAVDAFLESLQGLVIALVAISLIELSKETGRPPRAAR